MLKFKAAFGDVDKEVEISQPFGAGGNYHLLIDRYFCGSIILRDDGWSVFFNQPDEYTTDDAAILIDLVLGV